jgi:GDP-L-fucose synthase
MVIPTNLYGPNDNFDDKSSHVIPALIKKIYQAKKENLKNISVWGDGSPTRDFLYVDDAANGIILAAEKYNSSLPINLGSGIEISIKELVMKIIYLMDADIDIVWDIEKPNGQPRRCISIERARKEIGFEPKIDLDDGLKQTIDWYVSNLS